MTAQRETSARPGPVLSVSGLSVRAGGAALVRNVSFDLAPGRLVCLLGPNGAGKTTLLRAAMGLEAQSKAFDVAGAATLDGAPIRDLSPAARAQRLAYLPQTRPLAWPTPVRDLVALARFAHGGRLGALAPADAAAVEAAMKSCAVDHLAERAADTLSGGEHARVHIARAIATEAPLLIADEPTAALDPRHQHQIMTLIRQYVDNKGGGALCVLHDIDLAARYADRLIWMKDGAVVADGTPHETVTRERLAAIYGVAATVTKSDAGVSVFIQGERTAR